MLKKILKIIFIILYYSILILFCLFNSFGSIICLFSDFFLIIFYIIFPILLLILPIFLKVRKKIILSYIFLFIYIILLLITGYCTAKFLENFSPKNWNKYSDLRYLMIESLEKKYKIVGMEKEEIINVLGKPNKRNFSYFNDTENKICYSIMTNVIDTKFFCLTFDDNDIVIKIDRQ